jgi:hypothetical protein
MTKDNPMDYIELEKLYKFSKEHGVNIAKHGVTIPSQETLEKLRDEYKITEEISKYIQVLDNKKTVSFVLRLGKRFTLFENICDENDEYTVEPYEEIDDDER